ncbi:hypothetical protein BDV36DRAFT_76374 [Aspergillus pseudocaelatus]|uniref:Uncharacterized protein n=1 Tax=Aspergillus pseudocaelatus TaxID=1825620 RepID=A0ABQ6W6N0_9EURO|nr:hypothetical protein BDV36DRAFT_76374 [Aspergillus pseudocaelatus]
MHYESLPYFSYYSPFCLVRYLLVRDTRCLELRATFIVCHSFHVRIYATFMKKRGIVQESGIEVGRLVKGFSFFLFSKSYFLFIYFFLPKNTLCFILRFRDGFYSHLFSYEHI